MGNMLSSKEAEDDNWKSDARYAMESGTYCIICGGPFDLEGDVYNLDPKEPRYQWVYDFRLLGHTHDVERHRATSGNNRPRNTSSVEDVFLSERASFSMSGAGIFEVVDESGTDDIWYNTLWYKPASTSSLFALHEACIETSCRALDRLRGGATPSLAMLYQFLNARFLASHAHAHPKDDTANDIFDLCRVSYSCGPRSVLAMTRLEWWGGEYDRFYANPLDIPDLEAFVFNVLVASSHEQDSGSKMVLTMQEPRGIERLPTELFDIIRTYLPPKSVIKLHRTSKTLATKVPLHNAFWRDGLHDGSLHPHIWDLDIKRIETFRQESNITFSASDWDWRSVAKLLAMKRFPVTGRDARLDDMPLGFWNRCRIWSVIEEALIHGREWPPAQRRRDSGFEVSKT
ncbi:hypothetical protein CC86DRAFT_392220 [Ophiobolus disseminans]|uniref:F-box domain-containing protein n=1 Tax=Ophiobolus disseminans TaxID=1469910 RepID=A0A6A7A821_9PLEO|nr:hypothetical protein CC86DRAFT_392220 [Ophiobolus disseminans]